MTHNVDQAARGDLEALGIFTKYPIAPLLPLQCLRNYFRQKNSAIFRRGGAGGAGVGDCAVLDWRESPSFPPPPPVTVSLTVNKVIPLISCFITMIRVIVITVSMIDVSTNLRQSSEYLLGVLLITIVRTHQGLN